MHRRNFIRNLMVAGATFTILPGSGRIWRAIRQVEFKRNLVGIRLMLDEIGPAKLVDEPLNLQAIFQSCYKLKKCREKANVDGRIEVITINQAQTLEIRKILYDHHHRH